jgi:hypothetical protein
MLSPRQILEAARSEQFTSIDYLADGTPVDVGAEEGIETRLELFPPLSPSELAAFKDRLPGPLPNEAEELLLHASGLRLDAEEVSFTRYNDWGGDFLLRHAVILSNDGTGNNWAIEINPDSGEWKHVWFACHDPPVLMYQCETLSEFLEGVLDLSRFDKCKQGHRSILDNTFALCMNIWNNRRRAPRAASLRGSTDPALRVFVEGLSDKAIVADLRNPKMGDGFAWSSIDPSRPVKRTDSELLFAIEPKPSLFARLFGTGKHN